MRVWISRAAAVTTVAVVVLGVAASRAAAASGGAHLGAVHGAVVLLVGSIFGKIAGALLGAFSWTVGVAGKFILVTVASFVRMLIPASWAQVPVAVFDWIVALPNFAGTLTSPSGQTSYGFAGVNDLRELFEWIGIAFLPLTLTWAGARAITGAGDQLAAPIVRLLGLAAVLVFYPVVWGQGAAVVDQLTHLILSAPEVTQGIRQLMAYAVGGVALGGWQLVDLALMGAIALELLALIFVKVVVILMGAILYAVGPVMIGLVPTEAGARIARAWGSAAAVLLALPVVWSAIFAVGAVLVGDASTAGPLVGGSSAIEQLLGTVIVAIAGVATLWLCLRASREASTIVRGQIGVLGPAVASLRPGTRTAATSSRGAHTTQRRGAASVRSFQSQVRPSTAGAASTSAVGGRRATTTSGGGQRGRRGGVAGGAARVGGAVRTGVQATRGRIAASPAATRTTAPKPDAEGRFARARARVFRMVSSGVVSSGAAGRGNRRAGRRDAARRESAATTRPAAVPKGARAASSTRPGPVAPRPSTPVVGRDSEARGSGAPRPEPTTRATRAPRGGSGQASAPPARPADPSPQRGRRVTPKRAPKTDDPVRPVVDAPVEDRGGDR